MATPRHRPGPAPLTPDEIEQRQRADGTLVEPSTFDDPPDAVSPDELEQHLEVVDPDDYDDEEPLD